jgi:stearoyl-CoA desaturase (delta-9 desaturase)
MFRGKDMANPRRYARDLLADRDLRIISRTFPLWVLVGLALPFALGVALTGTLTGGLTGLLWGGVVRIFLLHHATFSINSLCHFFGRSPFGTGDESRNLAWLAPITFGEAWHNNHHAFPTSARHGLGRRQVDPGACLIGLLERSHLAWDVVRISLESQWAKRTVLDRRDRPT